MSTTDLDREIRDALNNVCAPSNVKARTLSAVRTLREQQTSEKLAQHTHRCSPDGSLDLMTGQSATNTARPPRVKVIRTKRRALRYAVAIAACLFVAMIGVFGYKTAVTPTAFVDIDVNPSIELSINQFGYVVSDEALNDDGASVLDTVAVVGKPYADAVDAIIDSEAASRYLRADSYLAFSVIADSEEQSTQLIAISDACIERTGYNGSAKTVDMVTREAARERGMGAGRYIAAVELASLNPSITVEECSTMTMGEITKMIDEAAESEAPIEATETAESADMPQLVPGDITQNPAIIAPYPAEPGNSQGSSASGGGNILTNPATDSNPPADENEQTNPDDSDSPDDTSGPGILNGVWDALPPASGNENQADAPKEESPSPSEDDS